MCIWHAERLISTSLLQTWHFGGLFGSKICYVWAFLAKISWQLLIHATCLVRLKRCAAIVSHLSEETLQISA